MIDGRLDLAPTVIRRLVRRAMRTLHLLPSSVITIAAVGRAASRRLNRRYRQRPRAANVLTFVTDVIVTRRRRRVEADIVLCPPVIRSETDGSPAAIRRRTAQLIVHGVLHAAGRHHQTAALARQQERLTDRIVDAGLRSA